MGNRAFRERLNSELDEIGVPMQHHERVSALAKLLHVPKFKAELILNGNVSNLKDPIIEHLAEELEVTVDWLCGQKSKKAH